MTDLTEADLKMFLASKLYETKQLSIGQAADVAGMSKRTFTEMLGRYGVSLFSQSAEELNRDIANAFTTVFKAATEDKGTGGTRQIDAKNILTTRYGVC